MGVTGRSRTDINVVTTHLPTIRRLSPNKYKAVIIRLGKLYKGNLKLDFVVETGVEPAPADV